MPLCVGSEPLCFAKIPCALKIARFPAAMAASSRLSLHPRTPRICPGEPERYTYKDGGTRTFFTTATLVRIKQLDRNDGAAPQVAHEKEQGLNRRSEVCRTAFPSRAQDACDPHDNSGHNRKAAA